MRTSFAALALCALSGAAVADDAYDRCINGSDGTNQAFADCGAGWVQREEDRLNGTWKRVFPLVEGDTKAALLAEQRAWIPYKEASCRLYAAGDFGREGVVIRSPTCRAELIADRSRQLDAYGKSFQSR